MRARGPLQALAATGTGRTAGRHSLAAATWPQGYRKASRRDPPAMTCLFAAVFAAVRSDQNLAEGWKAVSARQAAAEKRKELASRHSSSGINLDSPYGDG